MGWRDEKDLLVKEIAMLKAEIYRLKERIQNPSPFDMARMAKKLDEKFNEALKEVNDRKRSES